MLKNYKMSNQMAGLLSLGLGTIMAQMINLIIQPILTRIVTPEEIGLYNFVIALANLIIPIASLKLTMIIVISEDDDEAELLTDVSIITSIIVTIMSMLFFSLLIMSNNSLFTEIGYLIFLVPFIILTNAIRFVFISHNNRFKKYSLISRMDVLRELVKGIIQVLLGKLTGGAVGLIFGYAISPVLGMKMQSADYLKRFKKRDRITIKKFGDTLKKYKRHIMYTVPSQFINTFSYTFLNVSVISLFSAKEAGFYSISYMVLGLPLLLISNNVSKVYLQNLRDIKENKKSVLKNYLIVLSFLTTMSIIGFVILAFIAPEATALIFGKEYEESGKYITILCFMFATRFVFSSLSGIYVFLNKQNIEALFQIFMAVSGIIIYGISYYFNLDIYDYLKLISFSYGIIYILTLFNIGFLCKRYDRNLL